MDWFLMIFTMMPPHAEPVVTAAPMFSEDRCEEFRIEVMPTYKAQEGLLFSLECKGVKRPKKKEVKK